MTDDETPNERGVPPTAFQRWVAGVLEPLPPTLRIVLVGIACIALVLLPFILLVVFAR